MRWEARIDEVCLLEIHGDSVLRVKFNNFDHDRFKAVPMLCDQINGQFDVPCRSMSDKWIHLTSSEQNF